MLLLKMEAPLFEKEMIKMTMFPILIMLATENLSAYINITILPLY
jgi:hypothetical protein